MGPGALVPRIAITPACASHNRPVTIAIIRVRGNAVPFNTLLQMASQGGSNWPSDGSTTRQAFWPRAVRLRPLPVSGIAPTLSRNHSTLVSLLPECKSEPAFEQPFEYLHSLAQLH